MSKRNVRKVISLLHEIRVKTVYGVLFFLSLRWYMSRRSREAKDGMDSTSSQHQNPTPKSLWIRIVCQSSGLCKHRPFSTFTSQLELIAFGCQAHPFCSWVQSTDQRIIHQLDQVFMQDTEKRFSNRKEKEKGEMIVAQFSSQKICCQIICPYFWKIFFSACWPQAAISWIINSNQQSDNVPDACVFC